MQLYQSVRLLAGSAAVFDEDPEDVQTSEEPVPASFMVPDDGAVTNDVTSGLGDVMSPEKRGVEAIDAVGLSRLLTEQSGTFVHDTVVVDCRPYMAYSSSHIVGAHNVCFPSLLERRRLRRQAGSGSRIPPIPLENIVRCDKVRQAVVEGMCRRVVVYDEETNCVHWPADVDRGHQTTISSGSQLISVLRSLADCTSCELHFLQG